MSDREPLSVSDRRAAAALAAALFAIYAAGASPTIYVGDCGELATAVATLGIPHPSGYPLYVLLGKLWTLVVPIGSIAHRLSLFSAVAAAVASGLLFLLLRWLGIGRLAALTGSLLVAFAPSFWGEANVQRVYALNALFVVAATWAALAWERRRTTGRLALVAFLCGLGGSNHTVLFVVAAAFGLFAVISDPRILRRGRDLGAAALAFATGVSPYLYLPWRSRHEPVLDWGDPETLDRLVAVVTRRDFWERRWIETPADVLRIAGDFARSFAVELGWGGAALLVAGLLVAWRRREPAVRFALLAMAGNLVAVGLHGSRTDLFVWHRYYLPSYVLGGLLVAIGAAAIAERLPRRVAPLLLALPLAQLLGGWHAADRSRFEIADAYSRRLLGSLPPGARLAASDDNILFVLLYLHHVEGLRPDVHLIQQGVGRADLPSLRFDPADSRLFFTHHPNWDLPELDVVPEDLVFHVQGSGLPRRVVELEPRELPGESDPRVPKDYLTSNLIGEFHLRLGMNLELDDWPAAEIEYRRAAAAAPENDVLFYNLGLIYQRRGELPRALELFERSDAINPRHLASGSRVRASDRVEELRRQIEAAAGGPGGT